jgi:hypothetical protein
MRWFQVTVVSTAALALLQGEASAQMRQGSGKGGGQGGGHAGCNKMQQGGQGGMQQQMPLTANVGGQFQNQAAGLQQLQSGTLQSGGNTLQATSLRQNKMGTGVQGTVQAGSTQTGLTTGTQQNATATGLQALNQAYGTLTQVVAGLQKGGVQGDSAAAVRKDLLAFKQSVQTQGGLAQKTAKSLEALQQALTDLQSLASDSTLPTQVQAWLPTAVQQLQQQYLVAQAALGSQGGQLYTGGVAQ